MNVTEVVVMTGARSAGWAQATVAEIVDGVRAMGISATALAVEDAPAFFAIDQRRRETTMVVDLNHKVNFP